MSRQLYWWCLFCLSTFIASLPFFRLSRLFFSSMLLLLFESQIGAKKVRGDTMGWNNIWRNIRILLCTFPCRRKSLCKLPKKTAKKLNAKIVPENYQISRGETRFKILYMDNFGHRYDSVYFKTDLFQNLPGLQ